VSDTPPVVKVCCIASVAEAFLAIDAGAHALGLVSAMPSGPGVIADATIAQIAGAVAASAPRVETFLLTSRTRADSIAAQHEKMRTTTLQLVDHVPESDLQRLRALCPGVQLVQVIHVIDETSIAEALAATPWVDALLLDSGNPGLAIKELGGTGRQHDWQLSRRIRDAVAPLPLYLAGGLSADNVAEAIRTVRPYGLDLCNGVRTEGQLDAAKLRDFFAAARSA
jgi:phosphoribosylanthranilate isomerase